MKLDEVTAGMQGYEDRLGYAKGTGDRDLLGSALSQMENEFEGDAVSPQDIAFEFDELMQRLGPNALKMGQPIIQRFKEKFQQRYQMSIEDALQDEDYGLPDDAWTPEDEEY